MTTAAVVPAAPEAGHHLIDRPEPTSQWSHGEMRTVNAFTGRAAVRARRGETLLRPAVRRPRATGGEEEVRTRQGGHQRSARHLASGSPRHVACDRSYELDMHGSRLTGRGRVLVAVVWLLFAVAIAVMVSRPADLPVPAETTTVTVRSGDTLWALAAQATPGADTRITVEQIMELNGLVSAGDIHPGDLLVVPLPAG